MALVVVVSVIVGVVSTNVSSLFRRSGEQSRPERKSYNQWLASPNSVDAKRAKEYQRVYEGLDPAARARVDKERKVQQALDEVLERERSLRRYEIPPLEDDTDHSAPRR